MISKEHYTYYQPEWYKDDNTNIEYGGVPNGLYSFDAFRSEDECEEWLINHGYEPGDFVIHQYCNDDIEEVRIIDSDGDTVLRIEEFDTDEIAEFIEDQVIWNAGSTDNLKTCKQDDETQQEYEDRIYQWALDLVNDAIADVEDENDYNFQSYCGTPDTEWYDEARDITVRRILQYMTEEV